MKSNTTKEYPYSLDYYSYVLLPPSDGSNVLVKDYADVPVNVIAALSVNLLGELVIESPTKIQFEAIISNVLDRNGEEIYDGGSWRIFQTAPLLGPLGIKSGYKYRAELISGQI
jgi:hypothetical protein